MHLTLLEFPGEDPGMNRRTTTTGLPVGSVLVVADIRSRVPVAVVVDDLVGVVQLEVGFNGERFLGVVLADGGIELRLQLQVLAFADHRVPGIA